MTVSLKHAFTSNVADSADPTLVQPSNWNAEHNLTANANSLLGTITAGSVTEIACTSAGRDLLDDADAAAQRTTLGLGNNSNVTFGLVNSSNGFATTTGSISGAELNISSGNFYVSSNGAISLSSGGGYASSGMVLSSGGNATSTASWIDGTFNVALSSFDCGSASTTSFDLIFDLGGSLA